MRCKDSVRVENVSEVNVHSEKHLLLQKANYFLHKKNPSMQPTSPNEYIKYSSRHNKAITYTTNKNKIKKQQQKFSIKLVIVNLQKRIQRVIFDED